MDAFSYIYEGVNSLSRRKKSLICANASYDCFIYWKKIYGAERAKELLCSTVCIVSATDKKIKTDEKDLFNFCFKKKVPFSYDEFLVYVNHQQDLKNKEVWMKEVKSINDQKTSIALLYIMMTVATIDEEFVDEENSAIRLACKYFDQKFKY